VNPIIVTTLGGNTVEVGINKPRPIDVEVGTTGKQGEPGPPGPPGPEGGTPVVAIPYYEWPPVNPQPDTLYLRLSL
jgi:hypothetical protein